MLQSFHNFSRIFQWNLFFLFLFICFLNYTSFSIAYWFHETKLINIFYFYFLFCSFRFNLFNLLLLCLNLCFSLYFLWGNLIFYFLFRRYFNFLIFIHQFGNILTFLFNFLFARFFIFINLFDHSLIINPLTLTLLFTNISISFSIWIKPPIFFIIVIIIFANLKFQTKRSKSIRQEKYFRCNTFDLINDLILILFESVWLFGGWIHYIFITVYCLLICL